MLHWIIIGFFIAAGIYIFVRALPLIEATMIVAAWFAMAAMVGVAVYFWPWLLLVPVVVGVLWIWNRYGHPWIMRRVKL